MNDRLQSLLSNKIVLIQIGLVILLLIIIFIVVLRVFQSPEIQPTPPDPLIPSPTSVKLPEGTTVNPIANSTIVSLFQPFVITFPRSLSKAEQSVTEIMITPNASLTKAWSSDGRTLQLTPTQPLRNNTRYSVKITSPALSYTWQFSTPTIESTTLEDQIRIQNSGDREYGERIEAMQDAYPWLNSLPLQDEQYFVYFDTKTETFTGKLYASPNTQARRDTLKQNIASQLQALNIPYTEYEFIWEENR